MLYKYAVSQTFAIAQSTAVQFGSLHCAAILKRNDDRYSDSEGRTRYRLYSWGRGFYGQLGTHRLKEEPPCILHPRSVCLGYSVYDVRIARWHSLPFSKSSNCCAMSITLFTMLQHRMASSICVGSYA
jgi:Regulator of chromosome condensation (RCC1) repeat